MIVLSAQVQAKLAATGVGSHALTVRAHTRTVANGLLVPLLDEFPRCVL